MLPFFKSSFTIGQLGRFDQSVKMSGLKITGWVLEQEVSLHK
jgi:hypothetical protein